MSLQTGKQILLKEFAAKKGRLDIDFHGGEPLLNFEMIKDLCDWSFKEDRGCSFKFLITTNGTILTDDIKSWLVKNKDKVNVALSLDGVRDMHNLNRNNSFDKIDIDFFLINWPKQPVKMTVSTHTLPNIAEGVIFIHNLGFEVIYNLATGIDWREDQIDIYQREVDKLVEFYIKNPSIVRSINLSKKIGAVLSTKKMIRSCGSGIRMESYDTDGKSYPCHMFAENALDSEARDALLNVDFSDDSLFIDKECDNCVIYRLCPTCYGMNYKERGAVGKRDKRICKFNKIEILAVCRLTYNDLINKPTEEFTVDDFMELKAVKYIRDNITL